MWRRERRKHVTLGQRQNLDFRLIHFLAFGNTVALITTTTTEAIIYLPHLHQLAHQERRLWYYELGSNKTLLLGSETGLASHLPLLCLPPWSLTCQISFSSPFSCSQHKNCGQPPLFSSPDPLFVVSCLPADSQAVLQGLQRAAPLLPCFWLIHCPKLSSQLYSHPTVSQLASSILRL